MPRRSPRIPQDLRFGPDGLVPVVAQDAESGEVLMLAHADRAAIALTLKTGLVHFWSRSRRRLWKKGEESGNVLRVVSLHVDCDGDTVLARVRPAGPACHRGTPTCFDPVAGRRGGDAGILAELLRVIRSRKELRRPKGSYTVTLFDDRLLLLKKIGEEAFEVVHAAHAESKQRLAEEAADLVYHLLVLLEARGVDLAKVWEVLDLRHRAPARKKGRRSRR